MEKFPILKQKYDDIYIYDYEYKQLAKIIIRGATTSDISNKFDILYHIESILHSEDIETIIRTCQEFYNNLYPERIIRKKTYVNPDIINKIPILKKYSNNDYHYRELKKIAFRAVNFKENEDDYFLDKATEGDDYNWGIAYHINEMICEETAKTIIRTCHKFKNKLCGSLFPEPAMKIDKIYVDPDIVNKIPILKKYSEVNDYNYQQVAMIAFYFANFRRHGNEYFFRQITQNDFAFRTHIERMMMFDASATTINKVCCKFKELCNNLSAEPSKENALDIELDCNASYVHPDIAKEMPILKDRDLFYGRSKTYENLNTLAFYAANIEKYKDNYFFIKLIMNSKSYEDYERDLEMNIGTNIAELMKDKNATTISKICIDFKKMCSKLRTESKII